MLVIMITAYEDIASVVSSMKLGAHDYVVKPLRMDALEVTIQNTLENIRLRKEVQALQQNYLEENLPCFIAASKKIKDTMEFVSAVAKSPDTPILVLGETGTGKELIAGAIHYRVGGTKKRHITTRVVSATNKDMNRMLEKGELGRDLYFRLAVVKVEVPSLNRRREDIVPTAGYFLSQFSQKHAKSLSALSPAAEMALMEFDWKGNIRELKNTVEKSVLLANGPEVTVEDLNLEPWGPRRNSRPESAFGFDPIPPGGIDFPTL